MEKNNTTNYKIKQCLVYVAIGGFSYWIGKKIESKKWSDVLNYMAKTGTTMSNVVDGKEFICSVTEIK